MNITEVVYWGTGFMLVISILFILMVVWVNSKLVDQNKLIKRTIQRTDEIETLIKTEFKQVLDQLKKIKDL